MNKVYYYKVIELQGVADDDEGALNVFGRGGYELVAVIQVPGAGSQKPKRLAYLKNTEKIEMTPRG